MSRSRTLRCVCFLTGGLMLALCAAPALAGAGLRYSPGPTTLYLPELTYYQVIAEVINTGDAPDQYRLTVTKDLPADWILTICVDGACYPPDVTEVTVPVNEPMAPGAAIPVFLDITKMYTLGSGTFTVSISSENDPSYVDHVTYTIHDPTDDPIAFHFATGTNVLATELDELVRFNTALFNCGTHDDAYVLTVTRDQPLDWSSTICYDGICYPPDQTSFRVPATDFMPAGSVLNLELDFSPVLESGIGSMQIKIESETDSSVMATYTFYVSTEGLVAVGDRTPDALVGLAQATPNPFNPRTEIRFVVGGEQTRTARVDIYDLRGRQVRSLDAGTVEPGAHSVTWDGLDQAGGSLGAGVYLARVQVGGQCQLVKMSLVK